MPTSKTLTAVVMAALLVVAGCAGPAADETDGGAPGGAASPDDGADVGSSAGTVEFYVSDEENAIDDFAHLDVTITKVGLHRADGDEGDGQDDDAGPTETATGTPTSTESDDTETSATSTAQANAMTANTTTATAAATPSPTASPTEDAGGAEEERDGGEEGDDEEERDERDGKKADGKTGWVEYEVNETVDLTELQGANATKLETLAAPEGDYDKVFVYVDSIEATLENGETVTVKLPSDKLHIEKGFTVGNGENVSFVFDISVKKAGKSGKYILKPIISQSGTSEEVEIEDVDETEDDEADEKGDDEADGKEDDEGDGNETNDGGDVDSDSASDLTAEFQGSVEPGADATVKVTGEEGPVAGATVEVNDGPTLETDESGTVTFAVPEGAEAVEVTVRKGDAEAELEREFEDGGSNGLLRASA